MLLRTLLLSTCLLVLTTACDTLLTETPPAGDDFESPFDDLPPALNAAFLAGDANFERPFSVNDGLGPLFNNVSCAGCHPGDGRGSPEQALFRFSRSATDLALDLGGPQLQDKAIPGIMPEEIPAGVNVSLRLPPPVFGVGLIEAIPEESILANEDPADNDGDGISGRANWVGAAEFVPVTEIGGGPGLQLGRFGRKANVSSLVGQIVGAYHQDMGITSDFRPEEDLNLSGGGSSIGDDVPDPEIPASTVMETVVYVRLLAPPKPGPSTDNVERGRDRFMNSLKCASCHVPMMKTGPNDISALDEVDVHLYSDLLLHDMGPELADNREDGSASGTEWKTAPLWGTRIIEAFLNGQSFFLHDGRATSIHEAIVLHGGEAEASRNAYLALSDEERSTVIDFVKNR